MGKNTTDEEATNGILGLGGSPVPKDENDPVASADEESVQRRRDRLHEGEVTGTGAAERKPGATGIDMGAGGEGTDVSGR
jgi:hypothetical protein